MIVWLVYPFDPLPGEHEQLGRYGHLAETLRAAGHDVHWWTSAFSHRFKRPVDTASVHAAAGRLGMHVHFVPTPAYERNVSLRRLRNHHVFGRGFAVQAAAADRPDVILASAPPLESARDATRIGRSRGVPTVVDIQDQWPDNFLRVMSGALRVVGRPLLRRYYAIEREAYRQADAIVGVARGYVQRGLDVGGEKKRQAVFPLGVSLGDVRQAIDIGAERFSERWRKPENQHWLIYSGSLSHNYDFMTIIRAAAAAKDLYGPHVQFLLTGTGERADRAKQLIAEHRLDNVRLTGFLDFDEWAYLLSQCEAGFNASFPDALIYLPNKIFYYLAVGAAVLNTIPGECAEIVEQTGCGLNYRAGDVDDCFRAIRQVVDEPDRRAAMRAAAARLAMERFDRPRICEAFTQFLEAMST